MGLKIFQYWFPKVLYPFIINLGRRSKERVNTMQRQNKGFTILEIIVVLIVLSVLVAIGLVRYNTVRKKFQSEEGAGILMQIYGAEKRYYLQKGTYANSISDLDIEVRTPANFTNLQFSTSGMISCSGSVNWVAKLDAISGDYSLYATTDGRVVCTPCPGQVCNQMGYAQSW